MARRLAITWAFNTVALFVATWLLPGLTYGRKWWVLLLAGLVFTLVNRFVKPVLTILSIPFILVTLGLFYLLLNVLMLYATHWVVPEFQISSFGSAVLGAIIVSLVNWVLHLSFGRPGRRSRRRPRPGRARAGRTGAGGTRAGGTRAGR